MSSIFNRGAKSSQIVVFVDSPYLDKVKDFLKENYGGKIKVISDPQKPWGMAIVDPYTIMNSGLKMGPIQKGFSEGKPLFSASLGSSDLGKIKIPERASEELNRLDPEHLEEGLATVINLLNKIKTTN